MKAKCIGGPCDGQEIEAHNTIIEMREWTGPVERRVHVYTLLGGQYIHDPGGTKYQQWVKSLPQDNPTHD